jgi:hypothetical protein
MSLKDKYLKKLKRNPLVESVRTNNSVLNERLKKELCARHPDIGIGNGTMRTTIHIINRETNTLERTLKNEKRCLA